MAFNSYPFLLAFLPATLAGEYFLQHLHRNCRWWLLATSAIYYALCGIKYLPFGAAEILVNYLFDKLIRSKPQHARKILHFSVFCIDDLRTVSALQFNAFFQCFQNFFFTGRHFISLL